MRRRLTHRPALAAGAVVLAAGLAGCGTLPLRTSTATAPATTVPPGSGSTTPSTSPPTTAPGSGAVAPAAQLPALTGRRAGTALLHQALADGAAKHWVHSDSTSPATSEVPATTITGVDGPSRGTQVVGVSTVRGDIRVIGDRTWIFGSAEALVGLFQVPDADAESLSGRWVLLSSTDSNYTSVTAGVSIASLLAQVALAGTVTAGTTTLDGQRTTAIEGTLPAADGTGDGVLYLTAGADPLPLRWDEIDADGTSTLNFSAWGTAATVTAPAGAVPLPATATPADPTAEVRRT